MLILHILILVVLHVLKNTLLVGSHDGQVGSGHASKMSFSTSPLYISRLGLREADIYKALKNHYDKSSSDKLYLIPLKLLVEYLKDYEESTECNKGRWKVEDHPFLMYRMVWRFVHQITPLLKLWMQGVGSQTEIELAKVLLEKDDVGCPIDDNVMLPEVIMGIIKIQNILDLPAAEMAVGKFRGFDTGVGLTPAQMMEFANISAQLEYFVEAKGWIDVLEKVENKRKHKVDMASLKEMQIQLIHSHDKVFNRKIDEGDLHIFSHPLRFRNLQTFKQKQMKDWITIGQHSGYPRGRLFKALALCGNSSLLEDPQRISFNKRRKVESFRCWDDHRRHSYFTISPLRTEQLHKSPDIFLYHDIVSKGAIDRIEIATEKQLIEEAARNFNQGSMDTVVVPWTVIDSLDRGLNLVTKLEQTLDLKIDMDSKEGFRISLYHSSGEGAVHHDAYRIPKPDGNGTVIFADRIATGLLYLSDVALGGETVFTEVDVVVKPVKGSLLYWENYSRDGIMDWRTFHGPCPTALGHKLYASVFISGMDNIFTRPCLRTRREI